MHFRETVWDRKMEKEDIYDLMTTIAYSCALYVCILHEYLCVNFFDFHASCEESSIMYELCINIQIQFHRNRIFRIGGVTYIGLKIKLIFFLKSYFISVILCN